MFQMPDGGASTFIQIPMVGASGRGQIPDPRDKIKILLMIEAKNILIDFSGFSHGFGGIIWFVITTATHVKISPTVNLRHA